MMVIVEEGENDGRLEGRRGEIVHRIRLMMS